MDLWELAVRLLAGAVVGAIIGWERERSNHPAGLRTHILVALGASLITIVSMGIANQYAAGWGDPTRIAAQIVSGIGFLGAGTILREGLTIRGLTTAASLWLAAGLGMAAGAGLYEAAAIATVVALVTLILLSRVEVRIGDAPTRVRLTLTADDRPGQLGKVADVLGRHHVNIRQVHMETEDRDQVELVFRISADDADQLNQAVQELAGLPGIHRLTRE